MEFKLKIVPEFGKTVIVPFGDVAVGTFRAQILMDEISYNSFFGRKIELSDILGYLKDVDFSDNRQGFSQIVPFELAKKCQHFEFENVVKLRVETNVLKRFYELKIHSTDGKYFYQWVFNAVKFFKFWEAENFPLTLKNRINETE